MSKRTLRGPGGLIVELDRTKLNRDDPGSDTPALVIFNRDRRTQFTATLSCAASEGWLDGSGTDTPGGVDLSNRQMEWLQQIEEAAWSWVEGDDSVELRNWQA